MKILHLEEYEEQFLNLCKKFYEMGDRNKDWFNIDVSHSLPNRYKQYPHWSFLVDDDEFIAMAGIQSHFFPEGTVRLLTRTFYNPSNRRKSIGYEDTKTPAMYLLEDQMKHLPIGTENTFMSMEYYGRKHTLKRFSNKITKFYGTEWKVLDNLYQTYPNDEDKRSWQVVSSTKNSLPLKKMNYDEWKIKYE